MNLKAVAELRWLQLFPSGSDEPTIDREDFVATARSEYCFLVWKKIKEDKVLYGECDIPSDLLREVKLDVVDNSMDLSSLKIMRSIDQELWLQNIGGMNCECVYVKSTVNNTKLLCDDDSLSDDAKTYYPQGKKIIFPNGVHETPLSILYATSGEDIDDNIEIDDAIAALVGERLIQIYGGKTGIADKQNDSNSNVTKP